MRLFSATSHPGHRQVRRKIVRRGHAYVDMHQLRGEDRRRPSVEIHLAEPLGPALKAAFYVLTEVRQKLPLYLWIVPLDLIKEINGLRVNTNFNWKPAKTHPIRR